MVTFYLFVCFCRQLGRNLYTHVTCAVYNSNGSEVVASYNDDDIFLFDTRHSDGAEYVHKYEGHRNSATGGVIFIILATLHILTDMTNKIQICFFSEGSKLLWSS